MERNGIFNTINDDIVPALKTMVLDNLVLIGIILFLIIMIYIGWKKGFMLKLISLGSVVLTIIAEIKAFPYISDFIQNNETVQEILLNLGRSAIHVNAEQTRSPLYDFLGLDLLAENAGNLIGMIAAKVICFIAIFIIIRLLLGIAAFMAKGIKKIKLFNSLDQLLGGLFGAAEGVIYIWIFMFVVSGLPKFAVCQFILNQIMSSRLLLELYNQNILIIFMADMLR